MVAIEKGNRLVDNEFEYEIDPIDDWRTRVEGWIDHVPVVDE